MSRGFVAVRFPDGDIRWGIYDGTSDILYHLLTAGDPWDDIYPYVRPRYCTAEQVAAATRKPYEEEPDGEVFDVTIYSDYGGGSLYGGRAAKNLVLSPLDWEALDEQGDEQYPVGRPDWVLTAIRASWAPEATADAST